MTSTVIRVGLPQWQVPACVFVCVQGLLVPQGPDLGCYEQMVIITKAQKAGAGAGDRGCCFKSLRSQIDFSNLDRVILFSTRRAQGSSL